MRKFILVILSLLSINSFAQTSALSIEQAIEFALKNNANLKSVFYEAESQKQLRRTSFDLPKTDVVLMYGQYNNYVNDNNITITQAIPFATLGSQGALNRAIAKAGELKKVDTENELVYQIKQAYYQLIYIYARHQLLLKQDSIYEGSFKSSSLRYKTGEANFLEQTNAEVQRNEIKNQLHQSEADINRYRIKLQVLLNSERMVDIITGPLKMLQLKQQPDSTAYLLNPSLAYVKQQIEIANSRKKVESAKLAPDFIVGYFNQTLIGTPNPENNQLATRGDRFTGFQVGVSIPLWFVPHQARLRAAELNRKSVESNYQNYQTSLEGELQQAFQSYNKNKKSLDYYESLALPNSDLILKQSQIAFRSGDIGYAEYLLSLRNAITIKEGYLHTLNAYNQGVIYIEYLSGNK